MLLRVYFFAGLYALVNLALPLSIQAIIVFLSAGIGSVSLVLLISAVVATVLLGGWLQIMQMGLLEGLQQRIFYKSAFEFALRITRLKLDALENRHAPELMNRFFDAVALQKSIAKFLLDFGTAIIQIAFGLLLLSLYHYFFIAFSMLVAALLYALVRLTAHRGLQTSLAESGYKYKVAFWLEEVARMLTTFKLAASSTLPEQRTDEGVSGYLNARNQHFKVLITQYKGAVLVKAITAGTLLALGSVLVLQNQINLGQFVAAEIVVILILNSVEKLFLTMETAYDLLTSVEKLGAVADLPLEEQNTGNSIATEPHPLTVEFKAFEWWKGEPKKQEPLNWQVAAGSKWIIGGPNADAANGLFDVLAGFRPIVSGHLLINGLPLAAMTMDSLRSVLGDGITADSLFSATIEQNISLGRPAQTGRLTEVCELVGLTEYLATTKHHLQTMLLPYGDGLPDHVAERIRLARAIYAQPRLLLYSDRTACFDHAERERIWKVLTAANAPWTLIAKSNWATAAALCDGIVLFDHQLPPLLTNWAQLGQVDSLTKQFNRPC